MITTINGTPTYQMQSLGSAATMQRKVFGDYSTKDMAPYSTSAMNYLQQQQQNAYELELWNLANEYNSPAANMKRYQDAGLNPNLAYGNLSNVSPAPSSQPIAAKPTNYRAQNILGTLSGVNAMLGQLVGIADKARSLYDYGKYGAAEHGLRNSILGTQGAALENDLSFKKYFEYPMAMSRAMGKPISVTLPDGSTQKMDWSKSLDALRTLAEANRAFADTDVKRFMLENIYPQQVESVGYSNQILKNEAQSAEFLRNAYEAMVSGWNITNPYEKAMLWRVMTMAGGTSLGDVTGLIGMLGKFF